MAFQLARCKQRLPSNPSLIRLFSTSSSDPPPQDGNASTENSSQSSSSSPDFSFASYFKDVKSNLRHTPSQPHNVRNRLPGSDPITQNPASFFSGDQSAGPSNTILDIKKNLAEFRRASAGVAPPSQSQPQVSFHGLFKQNAASNSGDSSADPGPRKFSDMGFSAIREKLKHMKAQEDATEKRGPTFAGFQNMLDMIPDGNKVKSNVIGGAEASSLPVSVFGKEMEERKAEKGKEGEAEEMNKFVKNYDTDELGEKLKSLRPGGKKPKEWFSLQELNERLIKLRQREEKETKTSVHGFTFKPLRVAIKGLAKHGDDVRSPSMHGLDILSCLDTPSFMRYPPKEHLIDTYYHPDNMSSEEKMKLQLAKVREEFKKSESDCGSSLVQVAQLTVKIKHLSSVLHKKDKHSRKGLVGMVQKRKKILRYMRRKEWDDYCIALSKLGLRDNPDYKNKA